MKLLNLLIENYEYNNSLQELINIQLKRLQFYSEAFDVSQIEEYHIINSINNILIDDVLGDKIYVILYVDTFGLNYKEVIYEIESLLIDYIPDIKLIISNIIANEN
jgi:hypothetical protein